MHVYIFASVIISIFVFVVVFIIIIGIHCIQLHNTRYVRKERKSIALIRYLYIYMLKDK